MDAVLAFVWHVDLALLSRVCSRWTSVWKLMGLVLLLGGWGDTKSHADHGRRFQEYLLFRTALLPWKT